jgi:DNA mismatch repair protein MutL
MEPDLVAQIKAGEVIERPASVVKELLENAIDARAKRVRVEVRNGGMELIRVIDDGVGIAPDQLALAFAEHTSSKLHSADDLASIKTLGFRGEALYAISNVAEVEAISGPRGGDVAASVTYDHGSLIKREPAASGGGTRIAVRRLFAKVPARRKHLRSARSESAAVHQVVAAYALGHPELALTLTLDGKASVGVPGTGSLADAFGAVYGADLVDKMLRIDSDGDVVVSGLISRPEVTRPNRSAILVFVNGRPVRSAALIFAVEDAYAGLLMVGRHPLAAVSIGVPPDQIDPNVHPTKLEVRFLADRAIFAAVRAAVVKALAADGRIVEPRGALTEADLRCGPARGGVTAMAAGMPPAWEEPARPAYPAGISFEQPSSPPPAQLFRQALPALRVFGQAAQTFIVAEGPAGLYMIDQHAAHERVLYDELQQRSAAAVSQPLLSPSRLELSAELWPAFEAHEAWLMALGFSVEPFGDRWLTVRAVPLVGKKPAAPEVVLDIVDALASAQSTDEITNRALTTLACKAAVKAGQTLSMSEMRELVGLLEGTPNPRSCPHGRPTTIHISTERLEREFGRR